MTKSDLAEKVQIATGLTKKESMEMLESVIEIMKNTLEAGETIKISGFGSLVVKQKADRRGRNPQTGETIVIKSRRVLTFKSSVKLKNILNGESD